MRPHFTKVTALPFTAHHLPRNFSSLAHTSWGNESYGLFQLRCPTSEPGLGLLTLWFGTFYHHVIFGNWLLSDDGWLLGRIITRSTLLADVAGGSGLGSWNQGHACRELRKEKTSRSNSVPSHEQGISVELSPNWPMGALRAYASIHIHELFKGTDWISSVMLKNCHRPHLPSQLRAICKYLSLCLVYRRSLALVLPSELWVFFSFSFLDFPQLIWEVSVRLNMFRVNPQNWPLQFLKFLAVWYSAFNWWDTLVSGWGNILLANIWAWGAVPIPVSNDYIA